MLDLRPDELTWTAKHPLGVFCFYTTKPPGQTKSQKYFGISFQGKSQNNQSGYQWEIPRKLHENAPAKVSRISKSISCNYPMTAGTFRILAAGSKQLEIMARLLDLARLSENNIENHNKTNCELLKKAYQEFVQDFGLIHNYKSYWHNPKWIDIRLANHLEKFEISIKNLTGKREIALNKDLFKYDDTAATEKSLSPSLPIISADDLESKIKQAFAYFYSQTGKVDLEIISDYLAIDSDLLAEKLRTLELVFRDPISR